MDDYIKKAAERTARINKKMRRLIRVNMGLNAALRRKPEDRAMISKWQGIVMREYNIVEKGGKYEDAEDR